MTNCVISPNKFSIVLYPQKKPGHCASYQKIKNSEERSKTCFFLPFKVGLLLDKDKTL